MTNINIDTPGASGANPTATASDVAVNGSAATFLRSDGAPAVQKGSSSVFGVVKVDNTTITASGGVITAVPGGGGIGNVTGPASSTDTAIATWNGTAGTALRNNSATLIDASGNISTTGKLSVTGNISGANIGNITPINLDGNGSHVLLGNGTFGTLSSGNVSGPGSSTNLALVTWSGTAGTALLDNPNATLTGSTTQYLDRSGNFSTPAGTGTPVSPFYYTLTKPAISDFSTRHSTLGTYTSGDLASGRGAYLTSLSPHANAERLMTAEKSLAAGNFTCTAFFVPSMSWTSYKAFGLFYRDSSTDKIVGWTYAFNSGMFFRRQRWSDISTFNAAADFADVLIDRGAMPVWLQMQNVSGTVTFRWSADGENFVTITTESLTAYAAAPDKIGWILNSNDNGSGATDIAYLSCYSWTLV